MRLFMASSAPRDACVLGELLATDPRIAVVANAVDRQPADSRRASVDQQLRSLLRIGAASELDLRQYFSRPQALHGALVDVDLVWVIGGNAFVLRDAMRRSGFDRMLLERLATDSLAYGGFSAGACVCAPSLRGIELVDDVGEVDDPTWDGLGLVDFCIAPHYRSEHPEAAAMDRVVDYFRISGAPYRVLRDGEALVVSGGSTSLIEV
jgi:dipeptidase E